MPLSQIEEEINKLLYRKYNSKGCVVSKQDTELVEAVIKSQVQKNSSITISDEVIASLSGQISSISENITTARINCMKDNIKLKEETESLPHLTALSELLNGNEIQTQAEITQDLIHYHITDDEDTSKTADIISELDITKKIALLIWDIKTLQRENMSSKGNKSTSTSIASIGLFATVCGGTLCAATLAAGAYAFGLLESTGIEGNQTAEL